ncbi:MAG: metallophosphoesterase [Spirochaetales bacterium]|nr:metallophosphoesterase [Spirochaetales bacterium]
MYSHIKTDKGGHFSLLFSGKDDFKILQLTDLHLGFGPLSVKPDRKVLDSVRILVERSAPDLIVLTGDMIYPFLPKAGTLNNEKQMKKLVAFLDSFEIPYSMVFGNHDVEFGSKAGRQELAAIIKSGAYSIFSEGEEALFGVGNFIINLRDEGDGLISSLLLLDSNMYGDGWFFSGFDCIHEDQIEWSMNVLSDLKTENSELKAHAFFHMPLMEYKTAYEKMKLGDKCISYNFGSVAEINDYFGVSKFECNFFDRAHDNGIIKAMYCGHDHLNTIALTYRDIMLVYGMSLDFHAYKNIKKRYTQRGGTVLTIRKNGDFHVRSLPLDRVVSKFVRS